MKIVKSYIFQHVRLKPHNMWTYAQIHYIVCPDYIEDKLESRHHVTVREVRQVLLSKPRIRFAEKGHTEGNDAYAGFGQTFGGRYFSRF